MLSQHRSQSRLQSYTIGQCHNPSVTARANAQLNSHLANVHYQLQSLSDRLKICGCSVNSALNWSFFTGLSWMSLCSEWMKKKVISSEHLPLNVSMQKPYSTFSICHHTDEAIKSVKSNCDCVKTSFINQTHVKGGSRKHTQWLRSAKGWTMSAFSGENEKKKNRACRPETGRCSRERQNGTTHLSTSPVMHHLSILSRKKKRWLMNGPALRRTEQS